MIELNIIKEKINNATVVSFDIFDTLVFRNVIYPKDIFKIMDMIILKKYEYKGFSKLRVESESKARLLSVKEDVTLDEIYKVIEDKVGNIASEFKSLEVTLEDKFIISNKFMKQAYNYAVENKKRIFIISDMYLSSEFLEKKLKALGYDNYEKLYVSCEANATKASGSLYNIVAKENNIEDMSKWLHIGDNCFADIQNARVKGISTYQYIPPRDRREDNNKKMSIQESIITAICINDTKNGLEVDAYERLGKNCIAPIFYGFCDWLCKMTASQEDIVFLSRDGYFPKKLFDMMIKLRKMDTRTKYLLTSRKAYQIPAYVLMPKREAIEQLTLWNSDLNHKLKIKDIYKQVGLDSSKFEKEILSLGLKDEDEVLTVQNRERVKKLLSLTFNDIKSSLQDKLNLVREYLEQEGINDLKQINVMDIGWRGSVQHSMQKILNKDMIGFYFGTVEFLYDDIRLNSFGYFFDAGVPFENKQFVLDNIMMFELIFNSPEQSLNGFKKDENGKVVPVFSDKKNPYCKELGKIQDSALELIEKMIEYDEYLTGISSKVCLKSYMSYINEKNYEDMVAFKKMSNDVGVNDDDMGYVTTISKEDFLKKNGRAFKEARNSLWREAYVIEGIDTEEQLEKFYKENNIKYKKNKVKDIDKISFKQVVISLPFRVYYGTKNKVIKMINKRKEEK